MGYAYRVDGRRRIKLKQYDPDDDGGLKKQEGEEKLAGLHQRLTELQELLYAASETSVLVVLQGMDTSGKDGTIRDVAGAMNPQGCLVASFKVPTTLELAHDFLWRVHAQAPRSGQVTIFNRSHYEDVLVVRVHELIAEKVWRKRYDRINEFERLLADSNTIILKFYLHISRSEQERRLLEREQDTQKAWKLSIGDWQERQHWDAYTEAYEDAINLCSTRRAPWYIVPANKKWFRNLAVAETIVEALSPLRKEWLRRLEEIGKRELGAIQQYRKESAARKR